MTDGSDTDGGATKDGIGSGSAQASAAGAAGAAGAS